MPQDVFDEIEAPATSDVFDEIASKKLDIFDEITSEKPVIRQAEPGSIPPTDLFPAIRKIGGEIVPGQIGDTHPDIIKREGIPATDIDQRGFTTPWGDFLDREAAAQGTQLPTAFEPGRLHSTDLSKFQEGLGKPLEEAAAAEAPQPFLKLPEPSARPSPIAYAPVKAVFGQKGVDVTKSVFDTVYNTAKSVPEFLQTEEGMLAMLASATPLGRAGVEAYFTGDMLKSLWDQAKSGVKDWDSMSAAQKAGRITQAIATLGFTGFLAKAGIGTIKRAIKKPSSLLAPTVPQSPAKPEEVAPEAVQAPADIAKELGVETVGTSMGRDHYQFPTGKTEAGMEMDRVQVPAGSGIDVVRDAIEKRKAQVAKDFAKEEPAAPKEPWQMTKEEYENGPPVKSGYVRLWRGESKVPITKPNDLEGRWFSTSREVADFFASLNPSTDEIYHIAYVDIPAKDLPKYDAFNLPESQRPALPDEQAYVLPSQLASKKIHWVDYTEPHSEQVAKALDEGKPVPPEVLKDYPDLYKPSKTSTSAESKPEVATLATGEAKNHLGDPLGTTYRATPEDWAAWQDLQGKKLTEEGVFAERERIKNKYGGMPPQPPAAPAPEAVPPIPEWQAASQVQSKVYRQFRILENRFKNGTPSEKFALDMISDNEIGTRRASWDQAKRNGVTEESAKEAYERLMQEGGLAWSPVQKTAAEDILGPPKEETPIEKTKRLKAEEAEKSLTPMHKRYREVKNANPDSVVLMRIGDFYEAFWEDAKTLNRVTKSALTKRNNVPMSGVPYHAVRDYVAKLEASGKKVLVDEGTRTIPSAPAPVEPAPALAAQEPANALIDYAKRIPIFREDKTLRPGIKKAIQNAGWSGVEDKVFELSKLIKDQEMADFNARDAWDKHLGSSGDFYGNQAKKLEKKSEALKVRIASLAQDILQQKGIPSNPTTIVGLGAAEKGEAAPGTQIEQLTQALKGVQEKRAPLVEQVKDAFSVGDRLSAAQDTVGKSLSGMKAAGDMIISKWKGIPKIDDLLRAKKTLSRAIESRGWRLLKWEQQSKKSVPNPRDQAAISKWIDAGGDRATLEKGLAEAPEKFKQAYQDALNLSGDKLTTAQNVQNYFEARLQEAIDAGVLDHGIDNYIHRMYESKPDILKRAIAYTQTGLLKTNPALAKKRFFQFDWEAEKAGYTPVQSFIKRITAYEASLSKAIAAREFIKSASEMKASDGRPVIDIKGVGIPIEDPAGVYREATLIKPKFNPARNNEPTLPNGNPNPNYRGDYVNRDYRALSRWKWVGSDAGGKPIYVQGDVAIHPEYAGRVDKLLKPSQVRYGPYGHILRPALGVSSTIKQTMLDLSGFHPVQIAVHGMEHRVMPWSVIKDIDLSHPDVEGLLQGGVTLGGDYTGLHSEGLIGSSLTRRIPGLGPVMESYHQWLFQDFIPRIKMTMALHALERNRARYAGRLTEEQIFHKTASEANAAFGELNYTVLERSKTAQDMARLILLAPDFLEARARFAGQAFQRGGKAFGHEQRTALLLGALTMWVTARIANKMIDGQYHNEPENLFNIVKDGHAYGMRTVQGDLLHLLTKPMQFAMSRLNPVYARTLLEALTGRDYFGRKRTPAEQVWDAASTTIPISLRSNRERKLWESMLNGIGVTARRYSDVDDAFKLAQKWKEKNAVPERGEFIYDPNKDVLRPLKLALNHGDEVTAAKEIKALIDSKVYNLKKLDEYFKRFASMPFTGSKANDSKFIKSLTEDQRKTVEAARQHKNEIRKLYMKSRGQYLAPPSQL